MRTEIEIRTRLQAGLATAAAILEGRASPGGIDAVLEERRRTGEAEARRRARSEAPAESRLPDDPEV